ncbi:MAG: hypothetical protein AAF098_12645 [Pseudomonadota bacterium]
MKVNNYLGLVALSTVLVGCDLFAAAPARLPGGVAFQLSPAINSEGNCQPERVGKADVGSTGLFAVRGDATYTMPGGDTNIPFQAVFRYPDDSGYAEDKAITSLNFPGTCSELAVKIRIDYCEFDTAKSREERACPEIEIGGSDDFSSVEIERKDLQSEEK